MVYLGHADGANPSSKYNCLLPVSAGPLHNITKCLHYTYSHTHTHTQTHTQDTAEPVALGLLPAGGGFVKEGVEYRLGDFLYLHPQACLPVTLCAIVYVDVWVCGEWV